MRVDLIAIFSRTIPQKLFLENDNTSLYSRIIRRAVDIVVSLSLIVGKPEWWLINLLIVALIKSQRKIGSHMSQFPHNTYSFCLRASSTMYICTGRFKVYLDNVVRRCRTQFGWKYPAKIPEQPKQAYVHSLIAQLLFVYSLEHDLVELRLLSEVPDLSSR